MGSMQIKPDGATSSTGEDLTLKVVDGGTNPSNGGEVLEFEVLDPADLVKVATTVGFSATTVKAISNNSSRAGSPWGDIDTNREFLGVDAGKLSRHRCYLVMLVLDDSGSMDGYGDSVVSATKEFIKQYRDARKAEEIHSDVLVAVGTLNGGLLIPYTDVRTLDVEALDDFDTNGGTPLFDVTNAALSLQMAKTTELALNGITSKTMTVLMTDGCDQHSRLDCNEVRSVIKGLSNGEKNDHIVAGIYLGNADRSVFQSMGLKPEWILGSAHDSAKLLDTFSRLSKLSMLALQGGNAGTDKAITMS